MEKRQKRENERKRNTKGLETYIIKYVIPVHQSVATDVGLNSCKVETQNANGSLHYIIWRSLPKAKFYCLKRVEFSAAKAVTQFTVESKVTQVEESGGIH